jgi:nucleoside-diphosphate kinase
VFNPLPTKQDVKAFLDAALYPTLNKGLTELCKNKPENPTLWLGQWLLENNPNKPKVVEPADDDE